MRDHDAARERRRICIVHQQDGTDVRIGKLCRSLSRHHDVTYLGWDRDGAESQPDLGSARRRLFVRASGYGPGALSVRLAFLAWIVRQLVDLRPECVVAVNEELGFPLALLRWVRRFRLVIDIHDPLADRVKSRRLAPLLEFVQRTARDLAQALLVTDENRLSRLAEGHQAKAVVVPNYPNRPAFALDAEVRDGDSGDVRISVVGSLHATRGLRTLRKAIESCGECRVDVAGWIADDEARTFCAMPAATYHGVVGLQESLRIMAASDVVFCFYDPAIPNNVNASPNKIYEAICLGKKSIINSETRVARWVTENGFGYACPFADVGALAEILRSLRARLREHRAPDPRLVAYAESRLYWEVAEPRLLASI